MNVTLYLDTSIPSAYFDTSKPVRQLMTQKWFEYEAATYGLYISAITIEEIEQVKNIQKKEAIRNLIVQYDMQALDLSESAIDLANEYIRQGAIPASEPEDAYHVAIATLEGISAVASWNFKHLVSVNPIRKIHEINRKRGYHTIEIGSLELFGGAKYGNL